ncbi:hypothetical protein [Pseudarthrobacter sp. efr-133-R2A-89]|uniref:hypothetical protein n=1 Tax=Pseudarthrobacter sp. efr-133-R2A-89 TaxID=3040302 RepID=UPI0025561CB4|nr:hypothetical protein [Pseudarthrobacter sp. efr-133-R2A-89]
MNQQSFGQRTAPHIQAGPGGSGTAGGPGHQNPAGGTAPGQKAASWKIDPNANQAVLGPFTVRDLAVFAGTLILFVASLLPLFGARYNLWNLNNLFFLGLGIILPVIASALFAARRLVPGTKIRVGSLSIDQFASVVASFAVAFFFLSVAGAYVTSLLVGLIGSLVLFAATVLGRYIPYLAGDFKGRADAPAHIVAREAAVPARRPRAPKPAKPESGSGQSKTGFGLKGAGVFGGGGAGSSAVQPGGASHEPAGNGQPPATAAVPTSAPAAPAPAPSASAPAPSATAISTPVSTAPEVLDRTPEVDAGPPTQAADVVRPAAAPAAEETRAADAPALGAPQPAWEPPAATAVHQQIRTEEPIGATVDPTVRHDEADAQPAHEAFWFAVAQHRTAFDPRTGAPAFVIEPGGWVLALEDRGHEFLVQHTDGRLGILRDLSNIERG